MTQSITEDAKPFTGITLTVLTIAIAFATFMEILDLTIVNVAVPHIAGDLAVSAQEGTWAISSYALASAIMQPLTGWLAKRFGEVRTFCVSLLAFVTFSTLCGLAHTMPELVFFRLLQGAGSGPMVALSLSLLLAIYPQDKKGLALALWAMTVVIAPIFGPIMGGYITDNLSWPWIFFINAPVGLMAVTIAWTLLRKRETRITKQPIDKIGLLLLIVGVGSLQFMLDNGNDKDWFASPLILALGIIALVALTFLVAWELTDKHPVVDLSLFKSRNFAVGVTALATGMIAFFGINVVYPLWLQLDLNYTATWAGLATAPVGILAFILSPIIGRNIDKIDLRILVTVAFVVLGGTSYWFSTFNSQASFETLILPRLVMGIGIPCFFIPLNQMIISGLPPDQVASASGLANFFRTMASSVSTAVTVTLWQNRGKYHHAIMASNITTARPAAENYLEHLKAMGLDQMHRLAMLDRVVQGEALTLSVNEVFWIFAIMFVAMIPLIWLARPPFGGGGPEAVH